MAAVVFSDGLMEEKEAQVLQALAAAYGDNTSAEQRVMATQFLDTLQHDLELSYMLGVKFYSIQEQALQIGGLPRSAVQRFGLQMLAKAVGMHWARLSDPQKQEMKALVLKVAESLTDMTAEARFLRSAVVDLAVEVAIQRGVRTHLDEEAISRSTAQSSLKAQHKVFVLEFLCSLAEVVRDNCAMKSDVSKARKTDLLHALKGSVPGVLAFCSRLLSVSLSSQIPNGIALAKSVLSTLSAFVEWAPQQHIMELQMGEMLCKLLLQQDCRTTALECLIQLIGRKGKTEARLALLFPFQHIDMVSNSLRVLPGLESHQFHGGMAQMLCLCGMNYLELKDKLPKPVDNLQQYLEIMVAFLEHESLLLNSYVLPFWSGALAQGLGKLPAVQSLFPRLYSSAIAKMGPVSYQEAANKSGVFASDFGCEDTFRAFHVQLLYQISLFVEKIARIDGILGVKLAGSTVQNRIASGDCTAVKVVVQFIKYVLRGLFPTKDKTASNEEAVSITSTLLGLFLSWQLAGATPCANVFLLCTEQAKSFTAFFPFLRHSPEGSGSVLRKLMQMLVSIPGPETGAEVAPEALGARRTISLTVVKLCKFVPHQLLPILPELRTGIMQLVETNQLFQFEKAYLFEAMVHISNAYKNFQKQEEVLRVLVGGLVAQIASPELQQITQTPESLATFLGLGADITTQAEIRGQVYDMFSLFSNVVSNSRLPRKQDLHKGGFYSKNGLSHPTGPYLRECLPVSLALASAIHSLWLPQVRCAVPDRYRAVLEHDPSDIRNLLSCVKVSDADAQREEEEKKQAMAPEASQAAAEVRRVQLWLTSMRSFAYRIIANSCGRVQGFYNQITPEVLFQAFFRFLDTLDEIHLRTFFRQFLIPLVNHCPSEKYEAVLARVLELLLNHMMERLEAGWEAFQRRRSGDVQNSDAKEEIVEDLALRMVSKEFLETLKSIYLHQDEHPQRKGSAPRGKAQLKPSQLWRFSISQPNIAKPLLLTLSNAVVYPDSSTLACALELLTYLLPSIADKEAFHGYMINHLLPKLLLAVSNTPKESSQVRDISFLVDLCFRATHRQEATLRMMLQVPGVTLEALKGCTPQSNTEAEQKSSRVHMRKLLKHLAGARTMEEQGRQKYPVQSLIQKVFVKNVKEYESAWNADENADLAIACLWTE